jgi:hypothetical protein
MGFTTCPLTSFFLPTTKGVSFGKMVAAFMKVVEDEFIEKVSLQ